MAKKTKIKEITSEELNRLKHKGVAAHMVLQPQYAPRIIQLKNKPRPIRKMKHKGHIEDC